MEVFRICKEEYADKLISSGSANRWNIKGQNVIYTGSSRSLSTLELIVHKASIKPPNPYKVVVISIAEDDNLMRQVRIKDLPANWRTLAGYPDSQKIGSDWYNGQKTLVLKVPSAIITYEYNYVLNTEHKQFQNKIKLVRNEDYFWDSRLL